MLRWLRKADLLSDDPSVIHFGDKSKGNFKLSSSVTNGIISLAFGIVFLGYAFTTALPLHTGTSNTIASIRTGANVRDSWDFREPMSFNSFGVVPYLGLRVINKGWMTFTSQDEVARLQRIFVFGTAYNALNSDGSWVMEFEPLVRCVD